MTGRNESPRHRGHPAFPVLCDGFGGVTQSPHTLAVVALDALTAAGFEVTRRNMSNERLTRLQRVALVTLDRWCRHEEAPGSIREVAAMDANLTYDDVYSAVGALIRKGLVERANDWRPALYQTTEAGRRYLETNDAG